MKFKQILGNIRQVDQQFKMIEQNDRIAIGLSGGKDSMVLLACLNQLRRFKDYHFEIIAIHIDHGFSTTDFSDIQTYCQSNEIQFEIISAPIFDYLLEKSIHNKISCSRCSKVRKACMIQAAKQFNCNKIAFAHHGDDAIETLFLNMLHGARIHVFKPLIQLKESNLTLIRPLITTFEKDIEQVQISLKLPTIQNHCPNDQKSERQNIKNMLDLIYAQNKKARQQFLAMLFKEASLWK